MAAEKSVSPTIGKKIEQLAQISHDLDQGKDHNVTRLTCLKSLCSDPKVAAQFVFYLAKRAKASMTSEAPDHIHPQKWLRHKKLVAEALRKMSDYLKHKTQRNKERLRGVLYRVKELQNDYKNQRWGAVRLVESSDTLVVEKALECMLSTDGASFWAYHVAREYAESYDSKYGNGLTPASAPMMKDIVNFWVKHYGIRSRVSRRSS